MAGEKTRAAHLATDMEKAVGGRDETAIKVEAIEACIRTVELQILTANACHYSEAYILGMQNILIFHRATLERVKRGEGYHPSTPVSD